MTIGSGPPVVLVHGAWNWGEHWLGVAEEMAQSQTCWVMDRRARGGSGDGDDYSFDREVEDVTAVLAVAGRDASELEDLERLVQRGVDLVDVFDVAG